MIPMKELHHLGWFVLTAFIYVICGRPHAEVSPLACLIKAAPILALAYFVWVRGVRVTSRRSYAKYIFVSLLFAALGDTFIQLKDEGYFLHGMAAFAMSQALFVFAFGTTPVDLLVGIPINLAGLGYYVFLFAHPRVANDRPFALALAIYSLVICTMLWRALTRWRMEPTSKGKNSKRTKWLFVGFLGAASFVVSDSSLAWWMVVGSYPNATGIIMGSYYLAQLLISLSILSEEARGSSGRSNRQSSTNGLPIKSRSNGRKLPASRRLSQDSANDTARPFDSYDKSFRMYDRAVIYTK
ncbi:hypothetical protein BV898_06216 [Hypsibius exemplaris]|uniref:lysoplasmalogenase n=1 Tax=Hypsibius exemplaris TaxID=2072580 RepID=A0A1W0WWU7_HYPEX|nr:hypothetical protein BV898_06216 [Hypsibius exemplaris]